MRLKDIASIKAGHNFREGVEQTGDVNAHVIQIGHVERGVPVDVQSVSKRDVRLMRKEPEWLKDNDIIFRARGPEFFALHIPQIPANTVCTSHFFVIRVTDPLRYLPGFIAWQLNQATLQAYFNKNPPGSGQRYLRASDLKEAEIHVVDTELQNNIAYLDHITMRERKIYSDLLENRKQQLEELSYCILHKASKGQYR